MVHLGLRISIHLHYGLATFEVPHIFGDVIGVAWLCVFGLVSRGLPVRVLPFPGTVRDANGEPNPGKGGEDDQVVLNMCPLLAI